MKNPLHRICLALVMALSLMAYSQTKPLKIGDAIPASVWTTPLQVVNAPQKTTTLSADKGKLILLDFWNTWCSACLLYFPKMEKLKEQFGDKVKILAVGDQDRATLEKFFATTNGQRYKSTVSIAGDKMFNSLFPHRGVPYVVWIKDGKVLNTTDAAQVNEKTIAEVLGNEKSSLQTVVQMSRDRPLMLSEAFDLEKGSKLMQYSFYSKGRIRGIGFGTGFHRSGKVVYGRQFTNLSLMEIYTAIADEIFQKKGEPLGAKRIVKEVKDASLLDDTLNTIDDYLQNYEYLVPISLADDLYPMMLGNLSLVADYTGSIEKRKVRCLVLKRTSDIDKLASKGEKIQFRLSPSEIEVKNTSMYAVANRMQDLPYIKLPITNRTGYAGKIDIQIGAVPDLTILRKELSKYDLALVEEETELDMLIIKDKNKQL